MTDTRFEKICSNMLESIRKETPWRTGNLASKATKIVRLGYDRFEISVDEKIAPYFKYVNNAQTLKRNRYKASVEGNRITKRKITQMVKNKNYKYFERAFDKALGEMVQEIGGTLVHG